MESAEDDSAAASAETRGLTATTETVEEYAPEVPDALTGDAEPFQMTGAEEVVSQAEVEASISDYTEAPDESAGSDSEEVVEEKGDESN